MDEESHEKPSGKSGYKKLSDELIVAKT